MPSYYPIMLDVRGRTAIVVGGDDIAAEKAVALADSGAIVSVIWPVYNAALLELARRGVVTLRQKDYEPGDLAGAFVVVAAVTYRPELVAAIWAETQQRGQLVNIVDVPDRCSFIVPSILRRGQLTIAVSTEGAAPGLAKRIRQRLETLFPPAYGAYMHVAAAARVRLRASGVSYGQRDQFFGDLEASDVLDRLVRGDEAGANETISSLLAPYVGPAAPGPAPTLEEAS